MKKRVLTKALSLLLALTLLTGLFPVGVLAAGVPETLVNSLAELYDGDEARAREELDALYEAGIIDEDGNLVELDVREDGESVELDALAQRISEGETVGELTVNGYEATPEKIMQIRQVKSLLEVVQLIDEDVEVTDEHVANLESLIEGIADGSVDLENAIKQGKLEAGTGESASAPANRMKSANLMSVGNLSLGATSSGAPTLDTDNSTTSPDIVEMSISAPYNADYGDTKVDITVKVKDAVSTGAFATTLTSGSYITVKVNGQAEEKRYELKNKNDYQPNSSYNVFVFSCVVQPNDSKLEVIRVELGLQKTISNIKYIFKHVEDDPKTASLDFAHKSYTISGDPGEQVVTLLIPFKENANKDWLTENFNAETAVISTSDDSGISLNLSNNYLNARANRYLTSAFFMDQDDPPIGEKRCYPIYVVTVGNNEVAALAAQFSPKMDLSKSYIQTADLYIDWTINPTEKYLPEWENRKTDDLGYAYFDGKSSIVGLLYDGSLTRVDDMAYYYTVARGIPLTTDQKIDRPNWNAGSCLGSL